MGSFEKYFLCYGKRIISGLIAGLFFGLVMGLTYGIIGCTISTIMLFKEASFHIDVMVPETIVSVIYTLVFILGCGLVAGFVSKSITAGLAYVLGAVFGLCLAGFVVFSIVQSKKVSLVQAVLAAEIISGILGLGIIFLGRKRMARSE